MSVDQRVSVDGPEDECQLSQVPRLKPDMQLPAQLQSVGVRPLNIKSVGTGARRSPA